MHAPGSQINRWQVPGLRGENHENPFARLRVLSDRPLRDRAPIR